MKNNMSIIFIMFLMSTISFSQQINIHTSSGTDVYDLVDVDSITFTLLETVTVTDIDGNVYQTVKIGDQWWMAENLKVTHYRNGDAISNVTDGTEWDGLSTGAWCSYDNDFGNVATYGLLYNGYAVEDGRNLAPTGWHIPTDDEWKELEMYLGMNSSEANGTSWRGTDEGGKMKEAGIIHWSSPNTGATNSSGFTALPGSYRYEDGIYGDIDLNTVFWSSTDGISGHLWYRRLDYDKPSVGRGDHSKQAGYSVRCVKD